MTRYYRQYKGEDTAEEITEDLYKQRWADNYTGDVQSKFQTQFAEYYSVEEQ